MNKWMRSFLPIGMTFQSGLTGDSSAVNPGSPSVALGPTAPMAVWELVRNSDSELTLDLLRS